MISKRKSSAFRRSFFACSCITAYDPLQILICRSDDVGSLFVKRPPTTPEKLQTDKENEKAKATVLGEASKMNELIFEAFPYGGGRHRRRRTVVLQLLPCNIQRYHFQSFLRVQRTFFQKSSLHKHPDKSEFAG